MCVNRNQAAKGLTDVHKYGDLHKRTQRRKSPQTYTNTSRLTYISTYAHTKKITENPTKRFGPTGSGSKWTSGRFSYPGISDDVRIWPTGSGSKRHLDSARGAKLTFLTSTRLVLHQGMYLYRVYMSPNTNTQSIFTNTHKYEHPSQTHTNTSRLTYIST